MSVTFLDALARTLDLRRTDGEVVICGVRDERDAPAIAIAASIAGAMDLPLLLAHVLPALRADRYPGAGMAPAVGVQIEEVTWAADMIRTVAAAAGVSVPGEAETHVLCGGAEESLSTFAAARDAVTVVVGETSRSRLRRALFPSVAQCLLKRCPRPVLVSPRGPAAPGSTAGRACPARARTR